MSDSPVHEFGRLLIKHVRDVAIRQCDEQLEPSTKTPVAERWRKEGFDPEIVVVDCVDLTLASFLAAIDKGLIRMKYRSEDGEITDLNKEGAGKLAARFLAKDGWRAKYSGARFNGEML